MHSPADMHNGHRMVTAPTRQPIAIALHCTWGVLQTLVGLALLIGLLPVVRRIGRHRSTVVIRTKGRWGVSLGFFIFLGEGHDRTAVSHEYGHSIQSLLLGPLYLPLVGVPSFIRATLWLLFRKPEATYYRGYPERWADRLGTVDRKLGSS